MAGTSSAKGSSISPIALDERTRAARRKGPLAAEYHAWLPDFHGFDELLHGAGKLTEAHTVGNWADEVQADWASDLGRFAAHYGLDKTQQQRSEEVLSEYQAKLRDSAREHGDALAKHVHEWQRERTARHGADRRSAVREEALRRATIAPVVGVERLVGRAEEPRTRFRQRAARLARRRSARKGPVAHGRTSMEKIDRVTTYVILGVGLLLLLGLFTRTACLVGAGFLLSVVLMQPFWLPDTQPTYKETVELFALVALATTAVGRWAGLDFFLANFRRPRFRRKVSSMYLNPEEKAVGQTNFKNAVGVTRRDFLKTGIAAGAVSGAGLGAMYFGYEKVDRRSAARRRDRHGRRRQRADGRGHAQLHPSGGDRRHPPLQRPPRVPRRPLERQRRSRPSGTDDQIRLEKRGRGPAAREGLRQGLPRSAGRSGRSRPSIIALPLHLHAPVAIEAMKAGKHVLTEKLMAHSVHECKEMVRVLGQTNKILATGHQRHYSILYDNAVDTIRRGLIGDIHCIRAQWHRGNLPGHDSWPPPLPDDKMEANRRSDQGLDTAKGRDRRAARTSPSRC